MQSLTFEYYRMGRISERPNGERVHITQTASGIFTRAEAQRRGLHDGWCKLEGRIDLFLLGFSTLEEAQDFNPETDM